MYQLVGGLKRKLDLKWESYKRGQQEISLYLQGKVEMTIETMTKAEAEAKPAGEGREDPNKNPTLEEPKCVCKNLPGAGNFIL